MFRFWGCGCSSWRYVSILKVSSCCYRRDASLEQTLPFTRRRFLYKLISQLVWRLYCGLECSGFDSRQGQDIVPFSTRRPALESGQSPVWWMPEVICARIKVPGREVDDLQLVLRSRMIELRLCCRCMPTWRGHEKAYLYLSSSCRFLWTHSSIPYEIRSIGV